MDPKLDLNGEMSCEHQVRGFCKDCTVEVAEMARMNAFQHLLMVFVCLFNFEGYGIIVELAWCFQRLFEVGDYGPDGWFAELGIDWRKSNE